MERNSLMDRRYSLNSTHLANPIAESTCLNLNGSSSTSHFPWGGISISPKNRSNSSLCLTNSNAGSSASQNGGHHNNKSNSSTFCSQRSNATRINSSKIDPRIYADVQSKGLASRIVKYHEKGTRLNRSLSVNNLYNKPGQFPVVHLKKIELPSRATKQNLSMTRIAPPEKSMFYGNTLSSILRSNSIVSLHKSDEEISRENRPILHPPPTESELAPTRSVLEVLKEISRKRINSDDLDTTDSTKKYCNRELNEPTNFVPPNKTLHVFQSHKRQREHFTSPQQKRHQQFNLPKQQKPTSTLQTHHSPEQVAKKRLCSYNNDITSSLSSSQIYANKRKLYDNKKANESVSPVRTEYGVNTTKRFQRGQEPELEIPISNKQTSTLQNKTFVDDNLRNSNNITTSNTTNNKLAVSVAIPQRCVSEPLYTTGQNNNTLLKTKQKLTLFNKNYDECTEPALADDKVDDEFSGIPFVKPKKSNSCSGTKNPIMERTQKSKLALMLSGLRGELQYDEDEVDIARKNKENKEVTERRDIKATALNNTDFAKIITTTSSSTSVTCNTVTITTTKPSILAEPPTTTATTFNLSAAITTANSNTSTVLTTTPSNSNSTLSKLTPAIEGFQSTSSPQPMPSVTKTQDITISPPLATKTTSPLVGIKLTPQIVNVSTATTATPAAAVQTFGFSTGTTNANTLNTETATIPVLGGFAFNTTLAKSDNIATTTALAGGFSFNTTTANINNKISTLPAASSTTALLAAPSNVSPPTFTFGVKASKPISPPTQTIKQNFVATTSTITTPFAFSSSIATPKTLAQQTTITNTTNVFASASEAAIAVPTTTTTTGPFSFGNPTAATTTAVGTTSTTTNSFSFGLNSTAKPAVIATPFSINTEQIVAPVANNGFSFGPSTALKPAANISNNFTFGTAVPTTSATAISNNSFSFGANKQTNPTQFAFGGGGAAAATPQPSAFAPASTTANNFVFGGGNVTSTAVVVADKPAAGGFSFNNQTSPISSTATFGQPSSTNIFGGATATNAENGIIKPSFSFGGATSPSSNTTTKSIFESSSATVLNNKNSFASLANPSATSNLQNKSFAFGADNNLTTTIGANSITKPSTALASGGGGFSFNLDNNNKSTTFSFGNNNSLNTSSNATAGNNVTPFGFGTPSNTSLTNDASKIANKTFLFESNTPNNSLNTPSANLFGTAASASTGSSPFSFGLASNQSVANPAASPAAANANMFAPSPPTGNAVAGFGDRPIRRATRRLQKS